MKAYIVNSKPYDEDYVYDTLKKYNITSTCFIDKADFVIAIGGDASVLKTVNFNKLILPVNTGTLGFLSNDKTLDDLLDMYLSNKDQIDFRVLGNVNAIRDYKFLNEVSVVPLETGKLVTVDLFINNKFVTTYKGDGLIVATPTGSTAWSLSAGGSIVEPTVKCLLITPNNPFSLNHRPLIVDPKSTIELKNIDKIVIDGNETVYTNEVSIKLSKTSCKIIKTRSTSSFYDSITSKLGWGNNIK